LGVDTDLAERIFEARKYACIRDVLLPAVRWLPN
jgi:hypothetical protein